MGSNNSAEFSDAQGTNNTVESAMSHARTRRGSNEEEPDLQSLMAYLIRSGQIRFIGQDDLSDDSECSEEEFRPSSSPPIYDMKPDSSKLCETDLYTSILQSSGQRPIHNGSAEIVTRPDVVNMVFKREIGTNKQRKFSSGEKCLMGSTYLPNKMEYVAKYRQKAFCGSFSDDGETFVSACQDQYIRVYNTSDNYQFDLMKSIQARDVGWSVLDVAFSPDGRYAAYSSWSDCIHLCNLYGDYDVHEALPLRPGDHSFCIFSLKFSMDNKEILGGANDKHLYVYDREAGRRTLKVFAHDDDVNTVCFADASSQILYSGGDDGLCKVWDRRTLREESPVPVGVLAGHCDGVTYIDTKGDARFLISNSKDQSMKLWDVRKCASQSAIDEARKMVFSQRWDYRWQQVPKRVSRKKELPGDTSLMTYRGHCILHTLIRCKFSPVETTGQRYLYSGCSTGAVVIYDLLTGEMMRKLPGHNSCVRDVSWHPYKNIIVSTSWDYSLGRWHYHDDHAHSLEPGEKELGKNTKKDKSRAGLPRRSPRFMDL